MVMKLRILHVLPIATLLTLSSGVRAQCRAFSSLDVLFEERFEDANLSSRGWYDNTVVALSTVEHVPGSTASVEFRFPVGARTPIVGGGIRRKFAATDRVYLSYWVKYSANWTGSDRPYHPHEFHFVTDLDSDWVGPAFTHLTTYIEQNEGTPLLAIQDGSNIDQARVGTDLTGVTEARSVAGCNGDSDGYGPGDCYLNGPNYWNGKVWRAPVMAFGDAPGPYFKNDWHFVEAYFQLNSIAGGRAVADGRIAYWFDGQPLFDYPDVVIRTGQHPTMMFVQFLIAPYIGDGSPVDQTMWVDDLTVGRPGVSLLRNDELRSLSPPTPPLSAIFTGGSALALDERGADSCAQEGEGALLSGNGSSDDDDFYAASVASGFVDADSASPAAGRPLVFYETTEATDTLRLSRAAGRVVITY
jgi:hypothetical protein